MQTLTIDVQDSFVQDFLTMIAQHKDKIKVKKDKNLEYDPYFYERQKDLQQIIEDSESGKMELLSQEQHKSEMAAFFRDLRKDANT